MSDVITNQQYYNTVGMLNMLSRLLVNIPGHKEILWFTNDTDYTAPGNPNLILTGKRLRRLIRTLNSANVSLFPIDPTGLNSYAQNEAPVDFTDPNHDSLRSLNQGIDPRRLMAHNLSSAGAATFATRTGGRAYSDFNSITQILKNAQRYWNTGYVLYIHPPRRHASRAYYNVKVFLRRPKSRLIYRRGFYLRPARRRARILNAAALERIAISPLDWHGLPMRLQLERLGPPEKPNWKNARPNRLIRRQNFHLTLPLARLIHQTSPGVYAYNFTAAIITLNLQNGKVSSLPPNAFQARLDQAHARAMLSHPAKYNAAFIVGDQGLYAGRILLRDNISGRVGTLTVPINALTKP